MSRASIFMMLFVFLLSCAPQSPPSPSAGSTPGKLLPTDSPNTLVPSFEHVAIVMFENEDYKNVIGNPDMPAFNRLAQENTLLTNYNAVQHPSLPNYIALIGGDTFGITSDCTDCFVNATSLPDLIESSGRSWKTYQEDMPEPCYLGNAGQYAQKHNPFVYFDPIRLDLERCNQHVVPLTELNADIQAGTLPNFLFITPNQCNDGHNCDLDVADQWLASLYAQLGPALDKTRKPYLLALVFDEGVKHFSLFHPVNGVGGQVAAVLVSPQAKNGFQDDTYYTHYSLLKTIAATWGLGYLGHAGDEKTSLITAAWK